MTKSVRVINLPKPTRRLFVRALLLSHSGTQAQWIHSQIRRFIIEQQKVFGGDLFTALTVEEQEVIRVIRDGAAELGQIARETLIDERRVRVILAELLDRKMVVVRRQGKGRGVIYFPAEE